MFTNYLRIALRNLIKHRGYSLINILGLAIGLAVFALIASYVDFHLPFHRFHKDVDRIFSVVQVLAAGTSDEKSSARIPAPLSTLLSREFSEIEAATRYLWTSRQIIRHKKKSFYEEEGFLWAIDSNLQASISPTLLPGIPIEGNVFQIRKSDNSFITNIEIVIGESFHGKLPDDIDGISVSITDPSGVTRPLTLPRQRYFAQFRDYWYRIDGPPTLGKYIFIFDKPILFSYIEHSD